MHQREQPLDSEFRARHGSLGYNPPQQDWCVSGVEA